MKPYVYFITCIFIIRNKYSCGMVSQNLIYLSFLNSAVLSLAGGVLCFNIQINALDDYQGMVLEVEKVGRWSLFSKKILPYFAADDIPKETLAFVYKVLKN